MQIQVVCIGFTFWVQKDLSCSLFYRLLLKNTFNFAFDAGPGFNIFLRLCDFQLGPFVLNKYTAPGVRNQRGSLITKGVAMNI